MYAVILAGGRGERLRPYTDSTPKPMLEVGGKPILEDQIQQLKEGGITDVVIAEGYKSEAIQEYFGEGKSLGVNIHHLQTVGESIDTAGALKQAIKEVPPSENDFVVLWGDILSDLDFQDMIRKHGETNPLITMATIKSTAEHGIVRRKPDGKLSAFEQFPESGTNPDGIINAAVFVMRRDIRDYLPDEGNFSKDVLEKIVGSEPVAEYPFSGYWRHISTEADLLAARKEFSEGSLSAESSSRLQSEIK